MIRLEEKYNQTLQFRKRGFTYSEIAKIVGVSKSTVSNWCAKKPFSKRVRKENAERAARDNVKRIAILNKTRKAERSARYVEAVRSAETEFRHYKKDPKFMAGLMLYATLSSKNTPSPIRFTHKSIELHRIFIEFCESYLGVPREKIKLQVLLYPSHNQKKALSVWRKKLKLSEAQYFAPQIVQNDREAPPLHNGIGNTIIGNTVLKAKLSRWVELALKEM